MATLVAVRHAGRGEPRTSSRSDFRSGGGAAQAHVRAGCAVACLCGQELGQWEPFAGVDRAPAAAAARRAMAGSVGRMQLEPGEEIECKHGKKWHAARVLRTMPSAEDPDDMWVEVHFEGWDAGTDRFELLSAGRLRPTGGDGRWTLAEAPARGEQSSSKAERRSRRQSRRRSVGDAAQVMVVDDEQRRELLERGKGLAKLKQLPAAVLSGGLAPPTSGAWYRRTMSSEAKSYENSVRRPLYIPPAATRSRTPHEEARVPSRGRHNSRRPRTVEGGKGTRSLRLLGDLHQSSQLAPGEY